MLQKLKRLGLPNNYNMIICCRNILYTENNHIMQEMKSSIPGCSILSMVPSDVDGLLSVYGQDEHRSETCWWSVIAHDAGTDLHTDVRAIICSRMTNQTQVIYAKHTYVLLKLSCAFGIRDCFLVMSYRAVTRIRKIFTGSCTNLVW